MSPVASLATATARPGEGQALVARLLEVGHALESASGCQLYLISRAPEHADVVWISELWRSSDDREAAFDSGAAAESMAAALAHVVGGDLERTDLEPVGGLGYLGRTPGHPIVNLEQVEDQAPRFGLGDVGEARFARGDLGSQTIAVSLQRLRPGRRQAFGHRHDADEEIYVVLEGSGRVGIDGELHELAHLDAVRVAPGSTRVFEAGPDGLGLLAMGSHHPGDAEMVAGYWPGA